MSDAAAEFDFDYAVIGGGSAGYASARTAAALGLRVAVIEGGEEVGGLCILRGCMPSKAYLESAGRALSIRRAAEFGLRAEYHGADAAAIQARKQKLISEFADYRREQLETGPFTFIRGLASFTTPHELRIQLHAGGEQTLRARSFLIATGSEINRVAIPGLGDCACVASDEVLAASHLPASVVVLGGGAIALEFASYYAGLGCAVSIVQRGRQLLKEVDADVADALQTALVAQGISVYCQTALTRCGSTEHGKFVEFFQEGREVRLDAEEIVYALGRNPRVKGLALEKAGLDPARGCVPAGPTQQTPVPHIFAAGDVCGPYEVVHIAIQQGEIAARNAARWLAPDRTATPLEQVDYRLKLFAVFSHPEVAAVGLSECEAMDRGIAFIEAKYPFNDHGKSLVKGETHGFVKLLAARDTREIIGAAVIGPDAAELIHEIVVAMHFRAKAGDLAQIPHYHPTLSEIWTYPAEALAEAQ